LQQALEAWEHINKYGFVLADYEGPMEQAITTLKAALEQPEQEPVAWLELRILSSGGYASPIKEWHVTQNPSTSNALRKPLYTHPPRREWRGLTEEEIRHFAWNGFLMAEGIWDKDTEEDLLTFARAIEQACKERNP
jgi:hypothetical protein